jgi:hypothetical protein
VSDEIVLTENVPVARNRSVRHSTFRRDLQTIHLPDVDLPTVMELGWPSGFALAQNADAVDI